MRVYFEKPRTTVGWKGLINDPRLDDSFRINEGLRLARRILLEINDLELPAGTEYLDMITPQYLADLIAWGAIGARTTESQVHRELASGLSCPVGFKNGTNGDVRIAVDAIKAASAPHHFLSVTKGGHSAIVHTAGNEDCHIILRGGKTPNYDAASVDATCSELAGAGLARAGDDRLLACQQPEEARAAGRGCRGRRRQIAGGDTRIVGLMIESHLNPGRQDLVPRPAARIRCVDHRCLHRLGRNARRAPGSRRSGTKAAAGRRMKDAAAPVETELKLRIDPDALPRLARHPALMAIKRGRARTAQLISTYYDTPDRRLARAGVALRVRRDGKRYVQTVKGPARDASGGGLAARSEFEWPVRANRIDLAPLAKTPWRRLFAKARRKSGFMPVFTTDIRRTTIPVAFADSTLALACIDAGEIRTGKRRAPLCELEIELEAGAAARLFELAQALAADVPLTIELRSKAERGHALAHPSRRAPARAADVELPRRAPAGAALAAIVRNCVRQIEGNAEGLIAGIDPEWVHQMRIGARRLRSALALARGRAPDAALAPVVAEIKWLARALGPARDLDVFALETLPALRAATAASPLAPALAALAQRVGLRRRAARKAAREDVASSRFVRFLLAAGALGSDPLLGAQAGSAEALALAVPAREHARGVLKRRHRKLLAAGRTLATASPAERHVARIAAKKLRYAAEFFAPLFPAKRGRTYRKALTRLQEVLGRLNDAAVAATLARELAGPDIASAAAFDGWSAAETAMLAPELGAAWKAFGRAAPFWNQD